MGSTLFQKMFAGQINELTTNVLDVFYFIF